MVEIRRKKLKLRFGAVGAISTTIDFSFLFLLHSLGLSMIWSNVISSSLGFCFSFVANKKVTFKTTDTNIQREIAQYIGITIFGLWVIQSIVIWLTHPLIAQVLHSGMSLFFSKLLATGVTLVWNYYLYSRVVFKDL